MKIEERREDWRRGERKTGTRGVFEERREGENIRKREKERRLERGERGRMLRRRDRKGDWREGRMGEDRGKTRRLGREWSMPMQIDGGDKRRKCIPGRKRIHLCMRGESRRGERG